MVDVKRRRVGVRGVKGFLHSPGRGLKQIFQKSCLKERLGVESAEIALALSIDDTLNMEAGAIHDAGNVVAEDREQETSVTVHARRTSVELFLVGLGERTVLPIIRMEQIKLSRSMGNT